MRALPQEVKMAAGGARSCWLMITLSLNGKGLFGATGLRVAPKRNLPKRVDIILISSRINTE